MFNAVRRPKLFLAVCVVAFSLAATGVSAATLNVVGGQLLGASGVDVGGTLYNVEFLDGTCIALYSGCDAVSDFTFQSLTAAGLASQALLDQVFLDGDDSFDTAPELTNGCDSIDVCQAMTPFSPTGGGSVDVFFSVNWSPSGTDTTGDGAVLTDSDFGLIPFDFPDSLVWAVWTPVPEPSTALLMGLGLVGLASVKRRA